MRLLLIRLDEQEFELLWTHHHLLLDARSFVVIFQELFACYEAGQRGEALTLPPVRPFQDFVEWFKQQDWSQAEQFWATQLKGFKAPTPLLTNSWPKPKEPDETFGEMESAVSEDITARLKTLAQENEFTVNTIIQGAWALLLSRYSSEEDVLFGAVRAGRRSTIPGCDSTVGLFINTVPMRVEVNPNASVAAWLKKLRADWVKIRAFEHTPLVKVQGQTGSSGGNFAF